MQNQLFTPDQMNAIEQQHRISYGYKKVKSRNEACFMFELK